jgi:hypothetical protein
MVQVNPSVLPADGASAADRHVEVVFTITEGPRAVVRSIAFVGSQVFTESQLRAVMTTMVERAYAEATGYTNAIFYLSVLREARLLEGDAAPPARQTRLASAWGYWQTIRAAAAAGGSARAAQEVESALSRDAAAAWTGVETARVYEGLNDATILSALGIPSALQVKTPPTR